MKMSVRALATTLLFMAVTVGYACCMAFAAANPVTLVDEKAIIIWNAEQKREHFIRQASFDSEAEHFGFIVPLPSHPEVAEADVAAFDLLESLIPIDPNADSAEYEGTDSDDDADGVEVIEQYVVGDYEVTILTATDGKSMLAWLEENEYDSRPAMEEWLDHYSKMDWFFAALKFMRDPDSNEPKTEALRISFDTDTPFYPYKMPTDTWPDPHYRPLALYFIASGKTSAQYQDNSADWEAEVLWSGRLPEETQDRLEEQLGLTDSDFPARATVTVFHNNRNARDYDSDLAFQVSLPLLPAWGSFALLAAIVAVVIIVAWRRGKANAR